MRILKTLVAVLLASVIGTVASCGTMGGSGGMRHLVEPPPTASTLG
jgi:Na+/serine symporter